MSPGTFNMNGWHKEDENNPDNSNKEESCNKTVRKKGEDCICIMRLPKDIKTCRFFLLFLLSLHAARSFPTQSTTCRNANHSPSLPSASHKRSSPYSLGQRGDPQHIQLAVNHALGSQTRNRIVVIPNLVELRGGRQDLSKLTATSSSSNDGIANWKKNLFNFAKIRAFAQKNFFQLGMVVAVSLAKAFPNLGKNGGILRPELFIGKFGVTCVFLLSGLSLELSELKEAASNFKLNSAVQLALFGAWPFLLGAPLVKIIQTYLPGLLPQPLLDGLLIMTCLPTTVNMCILLTSAAGGSVASALCNAVISNFLGIFATPALLFHFFGASIELPFNEMVVKLCNKVLLPVAVGQVLRTTPMKRMYENNSKKFKRLQELILLGIVWNAFCNAFTRGLGLDVKHALALLLLLPSIHSISLGALFQSFQSKILNLSRGEVVAATFVASHKTLAFGLPIVNTIFEGSPHLASYCAPIMFIHPLQLVIGSILVPRFAKYVEEEDSENE